MCPVVFSFVRVVPEVAAEYGVRKVEVVAELVVSALVHSEHLFSPVEFLRVVARFHRALYFFEQLKEAIDLSRSLTLCPLLDNDPELWLAPLHVGLELQLGSLLLQFSLLLRLCFFHPGLLQCSDPCFLFLFLLQLPVGIPLLLGHPLPEGSSAGMHHGTYDYDSDEYKI